MRTARHATTLPISVSATDIVLSLEDILPAVQTSGGLISGYCSHNNELNLDEFDRWYDSSGMGRESFEEDIALLVEWDRINAGGPSY